jgi:hypothetical protein
MTGDGGRGRVGLAALATALAVAGCSASTAKPEAQPSHTPGSGPAQPTATGPASANVRCQSGWHVAPEAFAPMDRVHRLYAIAASSFDDVWAVGERFVTARVYPRGGVRDYAYPLIEHWDGSAWTVVRAADPNHAVGSLYGVTVFGPDDAWAVGRVEEPRQLPLVEHWDGARWSATRVPPLTHSGRYLLRTLVDVAGNSPRDVWALGTVGIRGGSAVSNRLLHWNGESWTQVAAPQYPPAQPRTRFSPT